jgi:hypothetical protein
MSQHDQDLQQEQKLLEHFRAHGRGEPSAAVDALILAAAHNALVDAQPRLDWSQRLHAWLFGAGSRTRWSMAVAGLAVFGIGLNLALHTRDQLPQTYDAPAPASAPALQEMAPAPIAEARKQSAEREYKKAEQPEQSLAGALDSGASFSVSPPAAAAPRPMVPAKPLAAPPVEAMADSAAAPAEADAAREEARPQAAAQAKAKAAAQAAKQRSEIQAGNALHEELSEDQLAETLGHSDVDEAPPLELQMHNVLRMRQAGQHADADRLLAMLKREFPQRDLDAELKRLQAELEKPDSSR